MTINLLYKSVLVYFEFVCYISINISKLVYIYSFNNIFDNPLGR